MFAFAPQREQHDFKTEQLSFSASNSIWPIVYIYIPCPNPLPAFPMMPQQMPDTEVESEQLFPLLHCCIILHNLLSFFLPHQPPLFKIKKPSLPLTFASSSLSVCRFILTGPLVSSEGPVSLLFSSRGRWRPRAPGGVARSRPRAGLRAPCGALGVRSRGRALFPSQDPFIALSAVNVSALHDALTSFFICSCF